MVETVSVLVATLETVLVDDPAGGAGSGCRLAREHTYAARIAIYSQTPDLVVVVAEEVSSP